MKNLARLMFMRLQGIKAEAMCLSTGQLWKREQECATALCLPSLHPAWTHLLLLILGPGHEEGLAELAAGGTAAGRGEELPPSCSCGV